MSLPSGEFTTHAQERNLLAQIAQGIAVGNVEGEPAGDVRECRREAT